MLDEDLLQLDAAGQAELVHSGQASPVELVDSAIDRIDRLNPGINAVIAERFEQARTEAESVDRQSAFAGVPMLLKDLGCLEAGQAEHQGSLTLKLYGQKADHDCSIVRRLKSAGFIVLGRTNVPEFGVVSDTRNEAYGATVNPWNNRHTSGGSSGGSAAAVAAGMVSVAHGNDGGGSIRIPASHCGLVGLKPTRGRVSHAPDAGDPMFGHVSSGVLTRSVRDTASLLDILAGAEPGDPSVAPPTAGTYAEAAVRQPPRLRIGYVTQAPGPSWQTAPVIEAAVEEAAQLLAGLGHDVDEAHPAAMFDPLYWTKWFEALSPTVTSVVEAARKLDHSQKPEFDPITLHWAAYGQSMSAQDLVHALDWLDSFRRRVASWWETDHDLLLCPVFVTPPPESGHFWSYAEGIQDSIDILRFTPQFNTTGQPAISIPWTWTTSNLPVGVQLVGAYGREDLLLSLASQIESARPWQSRYPAVDPRTIR
ncbi:MAG: amidase [Candidatus Dormiibacterota bacterium]